MGHLKILAIDRPDGCAYHRVRLPLEMMQSEEILVIFAYENTITEAHFQFADILYFNQFTNIPESVIVEMATKHNVKIVVDMDDYWVFNADHPNYQTFLDKGRPAQYVSALKMAHAVTTTNERLAEKIKQYNNNVFIVPNALPYGSGQFDSSRFDTTVFGMEKEIAITYVTANTNANNSRAFFGGAEMIGRAAFLDVKLIIDICGHPDAPGLDNRFAQIRTNVSGGGLIPTRFKTWLPPTKYMDHYKSGDIVISPMMPSGFSAMKSNIKILEAAAKKLPIVVSECDPYLGFPAESGVLYAKNAWQWADAIIALAENPDMREEYGNKLHKYCVENFHLSTQVEKRLEIIKSLL